MTLNEKALEAAYDALAEVYSQDCDGGSLLQPAVRAAISAYLKADEAIEGDVGELVRELRRNGSGTLLEYRAADALLSQQREIERLRDEIANLTYEGLVASGAAQESGEGR